MCALFMALQITGWGFELRTVRVIMFGIIRGGYQMPIVKIDSLPEFSDMYKKAGYPLGKSRRGFKKWIKHTIIQSLKAWVERSKNESYR
ncbi:hypothetical protein BH09PAT1_BH09PAT1_8370 [soil metagenome]